MKTSVAVLGSCVLTSGFVGAFQQANVQHAQTPTACWSSTQVSPEEQRSSYKEELLGLLGGSGSGFVDQVLADPITKMPIRISFQGPLLGDKRGGMDIRSASNRYAGDTNTYLNLLTPIVDDDTSSQDTFSLTQQLTRQLTPLIPPPLRTALAMTGIDPDYIPMRDLFTSSSVSFAYERGWRQGFSQAGFPGPDREYQMAKEYFAPALVKSSVVVDMSCATGLFTRRFAAEDLYERVLGCDYSDAMLREARMRISSDPKLANLKKTKLDLVRLDVGQLPMRDYSVDALHAGAAMHCWPDLDAGLSEIYRVLKPGGRYFATTFLAQYFSNLRTMDSGSNPSQMSFQYFASTDKLLDLLERNGFSKEKIQIEVLGRSCIVIRCEK